MTYINNVYICLAAPVLIAMLCVRSARKGHMVFLFGGMTACYFSSYMTTWLAGVLKLDTLTATIEIAPFVEELVKFAPILLYLLVASPKKEGVTERVLMVSVGFATFENVCYLLTDGSGHILHLLIRGFGTGAMHVVCGATLSAGILWIWEYSWLHIVGTIGFIAVAITYHGIYNLLVSRTGTPAVVGYLIPLVTTILVITLRWVRRRR